MRDQPRKRRYVDQRLLTLIRPLIRYSGTRDAYVLRVLGNRAGPALRVERRRSRALSYGGVERRAARAMR
jgi:hypothetical protein